MFTSSMHSFPERALIETYSMLCMLHAASLRFTVGMF